MTTVKLSSKNQLVLPREAREKLGVKPGDEFIVEVKGSSVILIPKPKDFVTALYGAGKGLYRPNVEEYLRRERASWNRRKYPKR